jgi:GAF domain-containing protein
MNRAPNISVRRWSETQKYALAGAIFGLLFPVIATILRLQLLGMPFNPSNVANVQSSDPLLWIIDSAPLFLGLFAALAGRRQDNLQKLNEDLRRQGAELEAARLTLEERVRMRTADLTKQASQLQTIAVAARALASVQDLDSLLTDISDSVSERFGYYHVGIFLLDEDGEFAVLRAANSEGGKRMLMRQHRLHLDNNSIVGYTAFLNEPRIALDVGVDSVFFNNPDLPETRSEMALPLRAGRRLFGVLDMQSTQPNAFTQDDISILEILADQIAIAIENARLFSEAQQALAEARTTFEKYSRQEWNKFGIVVRHTGFVYDGKQIHPLTEAIQRQRLAQTGSLSIDKTSSGLTMPIRLRGQTIGVLAVRPRKGARRWTQDELAVVEAAADRAALALENARLVENAQRRAGRERAIGEISSRIGAVSDQDLILQTAVEELGRKIGNTEIRIEIDVEPVLPGNTEL